MKSKIIFKRREDRETLERLKRWPSLFGRCKRVRIYSAEHGYYWRGEGRGYTPCAAESNVVDIHDAFNATKHCGPEKRIQFMFDEGEANG